MYLRRLSILVLLCCAASTLTQASPRLNAQQLSAAASSHQAAAKALLQATYAEDVIDQALYQLKSSYAHMLKDMPLKRQHRELETAYRQRAFDLAKQQLDWASIEPAFIELYMQTYSEQELLELSAFYRTDTGKSTLNICQPHYAKRVPSCSSRCKVSINSLVKSLPSWPRQRGSKPRLSTSINTSL